MEASIQLAPSWRSGSTTRAQLEAIGPGVVDSGLAPASVETGTGVLMAIGSEPLRRRILTALSGLGRPLVAVNDGYRLVERIADAVLEDHCARRPGLIIAEAVLAGCSALTVLSGIRSLGWDTPVILLTRQDDEVSRDQAWLNGVTALFVEPYDMQELRAFVAFTLDSEAARGLRSS